MSKGGSSTTTTQIPQQYQDFANENLTIAGTIANQPYVPFTGRSDWGPQRGGMGADIYGGRISGFTDDQRTMFQGVRDLATNPAGASMRLQGAAAPTVQATGGNEYMDAYFNPYENQVVQNTINDMNRANQLALRDLGSQAQMMGAYGGARAGVEQSLQNERFIDQAGNASAALRHQGFTTAAGLGQQDADRFLQGDMSNQAADLQNRQIQLAAEQQRANNLGLLAGTGGMQQQLNQARLGMEYGDFLDQQNYPINQLSIRQSALGMTPMGSTTRGPGESMGGLLGGLGGLAQGGAALYTAFCWVAREAYGIDNPRWMDFREWMFREAPVWLFRLYAKHGERFAQWLRNKPMAKRAVRFVMDRILGV